MGKKIKLSFTWNEAALAVMWAFFFMPPVVARISSPVFYGLTLIGYTFFLMMFLLGENTFPVTAENVILVLFISYCVMTIFMRTPDKFPQFARRAVIPIVELFFLIPWTLKGDRMPLSLQKAHCADPECDAYLKRSDGSPVRERTGKGEGFIGILYHVCAFYMIANCMSLFLFPHGIIRSAAGSAIERAQWLFGSKNNIPMYMILFMTIAAYYSFTVRKSAAVFVLGLVGALNIVLSGEEGIELFGGSSTGFVAYAAVLFLITVCVRAGKRGRAGIIGKAAFALLLFINLVILTGLSLPGMNDIIVNVFHKSVTFTGRTLIWGANLKAVSEHILLGHGEVGIRAHVKILNEWVTTDYTYNCLLKLLLNYGLVGIGLFMAMVLRLCRRQEISDSILFAGFIGFLFIGLMNEVDMNWLLFFPVWLTLCPHAESFREEGVRKETMNCVSS